MGISTLFSDPITFVLWLVAIVTALTVHEFSHALAGKLQGDPTAELEGRLNLNPLSHIDWLGLAMLVFVGFGWAKPTPFNPYNLKLKKWGSAIVALAGPLSNTLMVVLVALALALVVRFTGITPDNLLMQFLLMVLRINIILGLFNLVPIPPLDGSKLLYSFIEDRHPNVVTQLEAYGTYFLIAFIIFGGAYLTAAVNAVFRFVVLLIF